MILNKTRVGASRCLPMAAAVALLAANVAGCSGVTEQTLTTTLVSPDKYQYYSCEQIQSAITSARSNQAELEDLMAKASQGFGGAVVGTLAYRTDYAKLRGELNLLVKTSEEKQCVTKSPWSSERAVF